MTHSSEQLFFKKDRRRADRGTSESVCLERSLKEMDESLKANKEKLVEIEKIIEKNSFTKLFLIELESTDAE